MERVLERDNLIRALKQVRANKGSGGVDGMTVDELTAHLKEYWPGIRKALLEGTYRPQPVRRSEIPKDSGGMRKLGIPTVLDRFIQQAVMQVLQEEWDRTFSAGSYGFRPGRNAHQAIAAAQGHLRAGYAWVVDIDLEKFFDRVNHDKLMSEVEKRVGDTRITGLIRRFLVAGVLDKDCLHETTEGTPQGGPLSPLLANLLLDVLDRELERRGHRFARYADDCNIYVRSERAGKRVMASVGRFLTQRLKLKINAAKSAVGRPWERKFLGFTFTSHWKRRISPEAVRKFKGRIRALTNRHLSRSISTVAGDLRQYMMGWKAYFGYAEVRTTSRELDAWIRRRLRCYLWKQWGSSGYRKLRKLGVSRDLAWNTSKSAHGPWRLSMSPALSIALPARYFSDLGVPRLCATE
jgi:RNA-directed DNA polymerase